MTPASHVEQRLATLEQQLERADLTILLLQLLVQIRTEERDHARNLATARVERALPVSHELITEMFVARGWIICDGPPT